MTIRDFLNKFYWASFYGDIPRHIYIQKKEEVKTNTDDPGYQIDDYLNGSKDGMKREVIKKISCI